MRFFIRSILGISIGCLVMASAVHADYAITVEDQGPNSFDGNRWTLGFEFSPTVDMEVTSLGFFDHNANGLQAAHTVAIWDGNGNLLRSTTVNTNHPLVGFYRYRSIAPLQLTAGNSYILASHDFRQDDAIRDDWGVSSTVHPMITMIDGRWAFPSGSISFPVFSYNDANQFFNTASFEFTPLPEPNTACLVLLGLAGLLHVARVPRVS